MFWLIFIGARLQLAEDIAATRPARTLGAYVGGHDRLGE